VARAWGKVEPEMVAGKTIFFDLNQRRIRFLGICYRIDLKGAIVAGHKNK
jgi:hypothetical protein